MRAPETPRGARFALVAALLAASVACTESAADRILEVRATGTLVGQVFLDRNGNLTQDAADAPVEGVAVQVVPAGARTPAVRVLSTTSGTIVATGLPVGDYRLVVEDATVPDSLRLIQVAPADAPPGTSTVRLTASDTAAVVVVLSFPTVSALEARTLQPGTRVFVEGVSLNGWTTFGDSTLHLADTSGAIRATRVAQSAVSAGQTVRLLGTADIRDGQGTLTDATAFPLGSGQVPAPTPLPTAVAARADEGLLDAALVRVSGALILGGQANTAGDFVLTVTDGSGLLEVMLDRHAGIPSAPYVPGAFLAATGLLVPSGAPVEWQLKPRSASDLTATFPTATIAEARTLDAGRIVSVEAVALNSWAAFGDASVHLADATGTIRAINVQQASIFAGDRVRMLGTIVFQNGQPTLSNVTPSVLGPGVLPPPEGVTTARAASADGGRLDAALVRVRDAVVVDTGTVAGDFRLVVDDGTGELEVLLDRDSGFQLGALEPGVILHVTGLLVPLPGGTAWRLKPRAQSDVSVVGSSALTTARALGSGGRPPPERHERGGLSPDRGRTEELAERSPELAG